MIFFNKLDGREANMEKGGGKSQWSEKEEKLLAKVKKINRKASPRLCCWIFVFSILFIILACPGLDPLEGKYETLRYAASFEGDTIDLCKGKRVYMYDLPPEFNVVVNDESRCNRSLIRWIDLCPRFSNDGYGERVWNDSVPRKGVYNDDFDAVDWHFTDSYMLEKIFHLRLQKYGCLTKDASKADAFFVPFYTGLLALDVLYARPGTPMKEKKLFGRELLEWLAQNGGDGWSRFGGRDHFIIMGRTSWDFNKVFPLWGTEFSTLPYVSNMTSLLIERRIEMPNEIAIPYPTAFHPKSQQRLQRWMEKVERSKRKYLFSFVGAPRPDQTDSVRGLIGNACLDAGHSVCNLVNCSIVQCSHDPLSIYKSFLSANFCLQPRGDTATRRSTFDCLIAGAIPVFFDNNTAYTQYFWHLPQDPESYSVYISEADIKKGVSIQDVLKSYSPQKIRAMRRNVMSMIPSLIYNGFENDPSSLNKDAYDVTLERVLARAAAARKELAPTYKCWRPFWRNCYVE